MIDVLMLITGVILFFGTFFVVGYYLGGRTLKTAFLFVGVVLAVITLSGGVSALITYGACGTFNLDCG